MDQLLAAIDRLPRRHSLTEDEISLCRVRVLLDSNVWLAILTPREFADRLAGRGKE